MKYVILGIFCAILGYIVIEFGSLWQLFSILFIIFSLWKGYKQPSFINPYYLLIPTFISYALYIPDMGRFVLPQLETEGHLIIILCLTGIILGFLTVEMFRPKPIINRRYNENYYVIMTIGLIPTVAALILVGNPLAMQGMDAMDAKQNFTLPVVGQLAFFLQASMIVACKSDNTRKIIIAIIICIFASVISLTKTAIVITVIFLLIGLIRFRPDIIHSTFFVGLKKYSPVIIPIVLIGFFYFNNSVRNDNIGNKRLFIDREKPEYISSRSNLAENLYIDYLYFCSPWGNMQWNLTHNDESGDGANTFAQFGKKLGIEVETVEKRQPSYLNTHSFITDFYLDFGFYGAIIASYLLGCIIFFCFRRYGCSNDALLLSFYALVSYATLMLFFSNHFTMGYLLNYYITFGGYYFIMHQVRLSKK